MNNNMKNIKAIGLVALAFVLAAGPALAAKNPTMVETPNNQHAEEAHPLNAGYLHLRNSGTAEHIVCSGRCLLAGIIMGTGPLTSMVEIRNTSVANGSGAAVLIMPFQKLNTEPGNNPVRLPILLDKGISVTIPSASAGEDAVILYRDLD